MLWLLADSDRRDSYCGLQLTEFVDDARAAPLLRRLADDENEHSWARERALDALARIGDPEGLDIALGLVGGRDEELRQWIVHVLGAYAYRHSSDRARTALYEWLERREPETMSSLIGTIGAGADPNAVELLIQLDGLEVCASLLAIGTPTAVAAVPEKLRREEAGIGKSSSQGYGTYMLDQLTHLWSRYLEVAPRSGERHAIEEHIAQLKAESENQKAQAQVRSAVAALRGDSWSTAPAFRTFAEHPQEAAAVLVAAMRAVDADVTVWWMNSYAAPPDAVKLAWQIRALQYITGGKKFKARTAYVFKPDQEARRLALGAVAPDAELPAFAERPGRREWERVFYLAPRDVQEAVIARWREWFQREGATYPYAVATEISGWLE